MHSFAEQCTRTQRSRLGTFAEKCGIFTRYYGLRGEKKRIDGTSLPLHKGAGKCHQVITSYQACKSSLRRDQDFFIMKKNPHTHIHHQQFDRQTTTRWKIAENCGRMSHYSLSSSEGFHLRVHRLPPLTVSDFREGVLPTNLSFVFLLDLRRFFSALRESTAIHGLDQKIARLCGTLHSPS